MQERASLRLCPFASLRESSFDVFYFQSTTCTRKKFVMTTETQIDWRTVRSNFPVTEKSVYLNTAAAGPLSRSVMDAGTGYYQQMMADGDVHWNEWLVKREEVRRSIARFINAEPDEIGFTTNTSSGMNLIVDALQGRGEVIPAALSFRFRHPLDAPADSCASGKGIAGELHPSDIRRAMTPKTGIISLSHVQYSNGFRSDLTQLGQEKGNHALVVNASQPLVCLRSM